jgi:hypothetical protein
MMDSGTHDGSGLLVDDGHGIRMPWRWTLLKWDQDGSVKRNESYEPKGDVSSAKIRDTSPKVVQRRTNVLEGFHSNVPIP